MSQDLIKMSPIKFEVMLGGMNFDAIKSLAVQIKEFIYDYALKLPEERVINNPIILDLERKQTKIINELMKRGYLTKENQAQFNDWLYKKNKKKYF